MKFWDSSAIVPLFASEFHSVTVGEILGSDPAMYVWWGTRTECVSALMRRAREMESRADEVDHSRLVLMSLAHTWTEIGPNEGIRDRADRLLEVYTLRAADSFQLSAALEWCQGPSSGLDFVSLDRRLRDAALGEGFALIPRDL